MVQPDFRRIDFVPMRGFSARQQKIDAGPAGSGIAISRPRLAIMTALGMGRQAQVGDDLLCRHLRKVG